MLTKNLKSVLRIALEWPVFEPFFNEAIGI